jgi:hypothetical protein
MQNHHENPPLGIRFDTIGIFAFIQNSGSIGMAFLGLEQPF